LPETVTVLPEAAGAETAGAGVAEALGDAGAEGDATGEAEAAAEGAAEGDAEGAWIAAGGLQPVNTANDSEPAMAAAIELRENAIAVLSSFRMCVGRLLHIGPGLGPRRQCYGNQILTKIATNI
jgi:hypothetical protein